MKDIKLVKNNIIYLCDSCSYDYPECPENCEVMFGDGAGNDNICCCNYYEPLWTKEMMEQHIADRR